MILIFPRAMQVEVQSYIDGLCDEIGNLPMAPAGARMFTNEIFIGVEAWDQPLIDNLMDRFADRLIRTQDGLGVAFH